MADLLAQAMQHAGSLFGSLRRGTGLFLVWLLIGSASPSAPQEQAVDSIAIAIQEILAEIREVPQSGNAHVRLGEAYHARGNLSASRAAAERSLELGLDSSDSTRAEILLTDIALQQGRTHEAYRRLVRLTRKGEVSPDAMARLAQFQWGDHFREEALTLATEAAGRAPESPEIRRWLSDRWKEMGRLDISRSLRKRLAGEDQATDEDIFQLGYLSHLLDDRQHALDSYLRLLERNPDHPEANFNMALLLVAVGDTAQAIGRLESAITGNRSLQRAYLELAALYLKQGEIDRARTTYLRFRMSAEPDSLLDASVKEILDGLPVTGTR